jgi:hypothetical protein
MVKLWDEAIDKAFLDHSQPVLHRLPRSPSPTTAGLHPLRCTSRASPAFPLAHSSTAILVSSADISAYYSLSLL